MANDHNNNKGGVFEGMPERFHALFELYCRDMLAAHRAHPTMSPTMCAALCLGTMPMDEAFGSLTEAEDWSVFCRNMYNMIAHAHSNDDDNKEDTKTPATSVTHKSGGTC